LELSTLMPKAASVLERRVGREWGRLISTGGQLRLQNANHPMNQMPYYEVISARVYRRLRYTSALKSLRYLACYSRFIK
jgi:hypothetical protein